MRSAIALSMAILVLAIAAIAFLNPDLTAIHHWQFALVVALAGLFLLFEGMRTLRSSDRGARFVALGCLGGSVIAASFVTAEVFVGPPQRVVGAPGQTIALNRSSSVEVVFPPVSASSLSTQAPSSVTLLIHGIAQQLAPGETLRTHAYVLHCYQWPAAYVVAQSQQHRPQTVTQPQGAAFVSPVLQFSTMDKDGLPIDTFSVPALHREVALKYYPGLPARGIDIPFVQLDVQEENGGSLFEGVAVSGKPLARAGLILTFSLGKYPTVWMVGAPDVLPLALGAALLVVGVAGFMFSLRHS